MESNGWITAAEAVRLLEPAFEGASGSAAYAARMAICRRAHAGLIRARALRLIVTRSRPRRGEAAKEVRNDCEIPAEFWPDGVTALANQDWRTGDFEARTHEETPGNYHLIAVNQEALGVSFLRADVEAILPPAIPAAAPEAAGVDPDRPLLNEMRELIASHKAKSPNDAALMVAPRALGAGTIESKQTRLAKAYRAEFSERK